MEQNGPVAAERPKTPAMASAPGCSDRSLADFSTSIPPETLRIAAGNSDLPDTGHDLFQRHVSTKADWQAALESASSLFGINGSLPLVFSHHPGIRYVEEGQWSSHLYPIRIEVGLEFLKLKTSRNFRRFALLHELAHNRIEELFGWLGPFAIASRLISTLSPAVKERWANKIAFGKMAKALGEQQAKWRIIASHREKLLLIHGEQPSDGQLQSFLQKESPCILA